MLQRVVAKRTGGFSHAGRKAPARSDPSVVPTTLCPLVTGALTAAAVTDHGVEPTVSFTVSASNARRSRTSSASRYGCS